MYDFLGLKIVNVANPANPQVLNGIGTPSWAQNAVPVGNYLYLTYATGLMVIDISNPSTAQQVSNISLPGTTFGHTVNGRYLYTASWGLGIHIVDVNTPSSPQLITTYGTGLSRQIVIEGQYAYIANGPHGIAVLDISDPLTPSLVTTYATLGDVGDIAVSNGKIYVADSVAGLLILELTTTVSPSTGSLANTRIAFESTRDGNAEIYVMNTDGTNQTRLTTNPTVDTQPSWSPDGTKLTFLSDRNGIAEIFTMNADGTNQTRLTTPTQGGDSTPAWSPDGTQIAFQSSRNGNLEIYVIQADGTNLSNLTNHSSNDQFPAWSPDGTKLTFFSDRNGNREIYVMNADGTNQTRLTNNSATDQVSKWSPDGTKIAFSSSRDGNFAIYVMNTDGSSQTRITDTGTSVWSWSPDGTKLVGTSTNDGDYEVYTWNADGSNQTRLTDNTVYEDYPAWSPFPDSVSSLLFTDVGSMADVTSPGSQAVTGADYDNDGDPDLFAVGPNRLYRNNGNGVFSDLTATAGLSDTRPVRGGGWADYDRDGDLDLYVITSLAPNRLYRNNGNGTFTDVAATAGVQNSEGEGHGVSWIDYDNDGWLDLFVSNSNANNNRLYRNAGNGTFSDVTTAAGVVESGRSAAWTDYDRDGDLDFYLCKEGANRLYRNRGNGIFDEVGASAGVNDSGNGHGAVWGDYNQDGYPDLYVVNFGGTNRLYRNQGNGSFTEVGQSAGVDDSGNGTGAAWGDFDSDGDIDLYAVSYGPNRLYRNNGDGAFTEIGAAAGVKNDGQSSADAIWADYDADGDLDIYVSTAGGSNRLYRNTGSTNRWIKIRLEGVTTNENGIGAQIKAVTGQLRQYRNMDGGVGFMSQSSLPVEFGFGNVSVVDSLIIRWPSGIVQKLRNVATNQVLTITEAETPDPPALPVVLKAGVAFGAPGDTLRIPVSLTNANLDSVAGVQFDLVADGAYAQFVGFEDTLSQQGFAVTALAHADTTRFLVFSAENALIEPGSNTPILTALYRVTAVAPLGSTTPVAFSEVEIGDVVGVAFNDSTVNGLLQSGIRGDLNLDGRVSVLDIIRLARVLIGKDPGPVAGSVTFHIVDANSDTEINISDIVTQVNRILGVPSGPPAKPLATTVAVFLSDPVHLSDGTLAISLRIEADGLVAGLYATFSVDEHIQTGLVRFTDDKAGFAVDSHLTDGQLRVVAYTLSPYLSLGESDGTILIPVFTPSSRGAITLTSLQAVDQWGRHLPVRITSNQSLLEPDTAIPTAFSLRDASPNPFNPSTQIAYEVPQQAHVTLTVYNLLGQEVVTLVNEVKAAGRYTVTWNGRNARGLAVASGVYVYRMDAGEFSETKRMTLLK